MRTPKVEKMFFLAAMGEKSLRGVALSWDAHVMSASSGKIRQPCTVSLGDPVSCGTFLTELHFCAGNWREETTLLASQTRGDVDPFAKNCSMQEKRDEDQKNTGYQQHRICE